MKNVLKILAVATAGLGLIVALALTFRVGAPPALHIESGPALGVRSTAVVTASTSGRGLSSVSLELVQGDRTHVIEARHYQTRPPWAFWGERTEHDEIHAEIGREAVPDLQPGEAILRVIGAREPTWLLHPEPVVREITVPVRLVPPDLSVLSIQNYATQGGAGVVVYRVGDTTARDGVRAGQWFFPGSPLPEGGSGDRLCLFGIPWDLGDDALVRLVAEDDIGNLAEQAFLDRFFPKPPATDRIGLSESFMARVVPEIQRRTPELADRGDLLENYLQINGDLRRRNGAELVELGRGSSPAFLWTKPFVSLPDAQVMSSFADQRTYTYEGRAVDEQTHLGYDLASLAHAAVPAANSGVVRLARYFGIYGNTVVIDHGYGLMSLYSHLSSIEVAEGQEVERGATIGRTGATGLAGGDHLHFTTLIRGLPVNPTEWWDANWIRDRVARKLGAALPFEATP